MSVHAPALYRILGLATALLGDRGAARDALDRSLEVGRVRSAAYDEALTLLALAALERSRGGDAAMVDSFEAQGAFDPGPPGRGRRLAAGPAGARARQRAGLAGPEPGSPKPTRIVNRAFPPGM